MLGVFIEDRSGSFVGDFSDLENSEDHEGECESDQDEGAEDVQNRQVFDVDGHQQGEVQNSQFVVLQLDRFGDCDCFLGSGLFLHLIDFDYV